jgi:hypothetical protein
MKLLKRSILVPPLRHNLSLPTMVNPNKLDLTCMVRMVPIPPLGSALQIHLVDPLIRQRVMQLWKSSFKE